MKCEKCKKTMHFMSAIDVPKEKDKRNVFYICTDCNKINSKIIDLTKTNNDDFY